MANVLQEATIPDLEEFPDLVLLVQSPAMQILHVSRQGAEELGWTVDELVGRHMSELGDPEDTGLNPTLIQRASEGHTVRFDRRIKHRNGTWRNYNFGARRLDSLDGRFLLVGREMEALAHSHSRLAALLNLADLTDDLFVVTDREGFITYINAAAERLHGETAVVGRHMTDFIHADDTGYPELLKAYRAEDGRADARILVRKGDGSPVTLGVRTIYDRATQQWFTVERDISELVAHERQMRELAQDLRRQATTDELTGVANRAALNEILELAIDKEEPFGLMLLDMDDFKSVNDTLGHAAGDEFLRCVAHRMQRAVKLTDVVARLGGDEFVVYLPNVDCHAASRVAERMIEIVSEPYSIDGELLTRSCSIGVAVWKEGDDMSDILRKADRAAYRAKHEGRSRFIVCDNAALQPMTSELTD